MALAHPQSGSLSATLAQNLPCAAGGINVREMPFFGGDGGIRVRSNKTQPGRPHMMLPEESSRGQSLMRGEYSHLKYSRTSI